MIYSGTDTRQNAHHFRYGDGAWADLTVWLREATAAPTLVDRVRT